MNKAETMEEFIEQLQYCPIDGTRLRNSGPASRAGVRALGGLCEEGRA